MLSTNDPKYYKDFVMVNKLETKIGINTYKCMFIAGTEDFLCRNRHSSIFNEYISNVENQKQAQQQAISQLQASGPEPQQGSKKKKGKRNEKNNTNDNGNVSDDVMSSSLTASGTVKIDSYVSKKIKDVPVFTKWVSKNISDKETKQFQSLMDGTLPQQTDA